MNIKYKILTIFVIFFIMFTFSYVNTNALLIPEDSEDEENENFPWYRNPLDRFNRFGGLNLELPKMEEVADFLDNEKENMKSYNELIQEQISIYTNNALNVLNKDYGGITSRFKMHSLFSANFATTSKLDAYLSAVEKVGTPQASTSSLLGYTTNYDLKKYVKDKYNEFFSWDNWGRELSSIFSGSSYTMNTFFNLWTEGYVVPGLDYCANGCKKMVPQGVCIVRDYLFITEYCDCGEKHDSVICILNKDTGEYIKTVILEGLHPHVGGITFYDDGIGKQYVFITGYGKEDDDGLATVMRFNYEDFIYAEDGGYVSKRLDITVGVNNASFVSYNKFNNLLYVGYFSDLNPFNGFGKFYKVPIQDGTVNSDGSDTDSWNSELMQGCEFISDEFGIITTSGGDTNSLINIYDIDDDGSFCWLYDVICTPPYLEEVAIDFETGKMFCVFESGAKSYKSNTRLALDRVIVLDFKDYIEAYGGKLTGPHN